MCDIRVEGERRWAATWRSPNSKTCPNPPVPRWHAPRARRGGGPSSRLRSSCLKPLAASAIRCATAIPAPQTDSLPAMSGRLEHIRIATDERRRQQRQAPVGQPRRSARATAPDRRHRRHHQGVRGCRRLSTRNTDDRAESLAVPRARGLVPDEQLRPDARRPLWAPQRAQRRPARRRAAAGSGQSPRERSRRVGTVASTAATATSPGPHQARGGGTRCAQHGTSVTTVLLTPIPFLAAETWVHQQRAAMRG